MEDETRRRSTAGRRSSRPMRVDYYTVQPSPSQWIVVASVEDGGDADPLAGTTLVVGSAASRDAAIGDMVRRISHSITLDRQRASAELLRT